MAIDTKKIDTLIQYVLLVAGSLDDWTNRSLGPIHLIKYVYLADLAYAKRNHGKTLTSVHWQFYKFGPWSQEVNARIDPALNEIHAIRKKIESDYGNDDWCRWSISSDHLLKEKERLLPLLAHARLPKEIKDFSNDTSRLLDYVYKTTPMLSAKPMEYLNFRLACPKTKDTYTPEPTKYSALSKRKKKLLAERAGTLTKPKKEKPKLICPVANQRYDEVYDEGVKWLDSMAGPGFSDTTVDARFSDEVWDSVTRKGNDLS